MRAQSRKILEYPSDLVKWVVGIALHAMNANLDITEVYTACRFAIAIVTDPSRFSMSDHVTLIFNSYEGAEPSSSGFAGCEYKIRITIKSSGIKIYWNNNSFDTFGDPSCYVIEKGHWAYPISASNQLTFEDCRDSHLYCCKSLFKAVAVIRGKRNVWSMKINQESDP